MNKTNEEVKWKDLYNFIEEPQKELQNTSHGIIQWKGTDVCMTAICDCGNSMHFDREFLYYIECNNCNEIYAVGSYVKLISLPQKYKEYIKKENFTINISDIYTLPQNTEFLNDR